MCSTKANQENSPLLRLPAELRNQIYAYVCDTMTVDVPEKYKYVRSGSSMRLVCRQMKDEATDIVERYFIVQFSDKVDRIKAIFKLPRMEAILEMEMHLGLLQNIVKEWNVGIDCEVCGPLEFKTFSSLRRVKVHNWVQYDDLVEDRDILRYSFCNKDLDVVFT